MNILSKQNNQLSASPIIQINKEITVTKIVLNQDHVSDLPLLSELLNSLSIEPDGSCLEEAF
jgi:hypothetical protein